MSSEYWRARAANTWRRYRSSLLPRLEAGEPAVQAALHEPKLAQSVRPGSSVPATEAVEFVVFTREQMVDGYDIYASAPGRPPVSVEIDARTA